MKPWLTAALLIAGYVLACRWAAAAAALPPANVVLGDEVFLNETWRELHGRCIGIVTNQTGVTSRLESIVDASKRNSQICIKAIFSPEHGLRGDQPAGAYVASYTDERSGLPVYSLYGPTRHPSPEMLEGIDVLLFDIQDVGARAYTYVSTMAYVMQAARAQHKEVWVLDRPNPIGGQVVEGPVLDPKYASFIGLYPIAMRHGMTVGELARMFNEHFGIGCALRVIAMRNYHRAMLWPDTGLAWVQTSPNIPEWDTTLLYPGTGSIDNAGLNNGTGFTKPFKYAGADGLDASRLADHLNARPIPGIFFRPAAWMPATGLWAGKNLSGVELIVTEPRAVRAVRAAVEILVAVRKISPASLRIASNTALDRDWGTDSLRNGLTSGASAEVIMRSLEESIPQFEALRSKYLIYE